MARALKMGSPTPPKISNTARGRAPDLSKFFTFVQNVEG